MKQSLPYDKIFTLSIDIPNAECWNWSNNERVTLPANTRVRVLRVYDATHTTIEVVDQNNNTVEFAPNGYRWIVPNTILAKAIDAYVPERTADLIGDIIAYESGEASEQQTKKLFKKLQKTGIGRKLQGHYSSRMGGATNA